MERGQVLVIAVVVAALALFGLRFFSGSSDVELASLGRNERLGPDGSPLEDGSGRLGEPGHSRLGSFGSGVDRSRGGAAGSGDRTGSGSGRVGSGTIIGGARSGGSGLGISGSTREGASGGSSGSGGPAVAAAAGRIGPKTEHRSDLVESLGARPPTQSDLAAPPKPDNGDDVALKLEKTEDIGEQAGREQDVEKPTDGNDGIKITEQGRIEFPNGGNASGDGGSISFKIKPDWSGSDQTDNALVQVRQEHEWNNRLEIVKNGEFLRFILTDDTGKEADISSRITNWQADEEHNIVASWDGQEKRTRLYIDDQLVGENQYSGRLQIQEHTPMYVGADWRGSNYSGANATLYGFTVSTSPFFK
ncbi:MAG: LamG-like jellyroll fold domain-containing protein [bacterium]